MTLVNSLLNFKCTSHLFEHMWYKDNEFTNKLVVYSLWNCTLHRNNITIQDGNVIYRNTI